MNDSRALKIRVLKYLIPVTLICVTFNITRFFEIKTVYIPIPSNQTTLKLNETAEADLFQNTSAASIAIPLENMTTIAAHSGKY